MKDRSLYLLFLANILENYDVALYGYLVTRLSPLFFPHEDPHVSMIFGLATFASGFFMRPLGGTIFGHVSDRFGRKLAIRLSIFLTAIPTSMMGFLPTYNDIGLFAPGMLIFCRLIQGLCMGGESATILVYVLEKAHSGQQNLIGSILCSTAFAGIILGAITGAVFTLDFMPPWSWRIPFLIGIPVAAYSYYLRRNLQETLAFRKDSAPIQRIPIIEAFRNHPGNLACTFGLGAACSIPFHILTIYGNGLLTTKFGLPLPGAIGVTVFLLGTLGIILPLWGKLADHYGSAPLMKISMACIFLAAWPVFILMGSQEIGIFITGQLVLLLVFSAFLASVSAFLVSMFPVRTRSSSIGFAYNLGNCLLGGTTPLIATYLVKATNHFQSPALYLAFGSILGLVSVFAAKPEQAGNSKYKTKNQ